MKLTPALSLTAALAPMVGLILLLASCSPAPSAIPRIAHAGGALQGLSYTNSIEALDSNYGAGFRAFEIDLSWTVDGQLVCLHDWEVGFEESFGYSIAAPLRLTEFEQLASTHPVYSKCTLDSLMAWFANHPDASLITDLKEGNIPALQLIADRFPQQLSQLIPQIYQPPEYPVVKELGYQRIIWTLYQFPRGSNDVIEELQQMDLWAVTMDQVRANRELGLELDELGVDTYVHTINEYPDFLYFKNLGIDEIYTDSLTDRSLGKLRWKPWINSKDSSYYQDQQQQREKLEKLVREFRQQPRQLYSLDNADRSEINFISQIANVEDFQAGFSFQATGTDPYFLLPVLATPVNELQLHLRLSVPDASITQLFYSTIDDQRFVAERVETLPTQLNWQRQGENELVFHLRSDIPIRQLRIDTGRFPGQYIVSELEVRTGELLP